ncbi:ShlB/FhaC/HecB family hemolysin secretion/activation protein [Arcobacter sp.]|uniref:ShlB/FhaC/HecB family hemolysin secretion/activation protein n=1 Tax=Arcobacter sp. TaxID=1872629 RepID=UPI003D12D44A
MRNTILKTITLSTFASTVLFAATPNIGDIEKQIKTPKIQKEAPSLPSIGSGEYKTPMVDSGKTIFVKGFTFTGNTYISNEELQTLTKEYENKELTFTKINELTSKITKLYRSKGYFVARAYLPQQNILDNDNILEIAIIEGNYGEFHLKNNSLVKNNIVQGMLDYAKRENVVSTRTLEQSMLIINDTPGVVVTTADVMPGKMVGTSDFSITTEASKAYNGYIIIDNQGSRYTGKNRIMAGANFNSPFKIGDKISLNGLVSNGANLTNGRVAYSAPLMSNGLRGELSYTQTNYSLVKEYKALDAKGDSKTIEAKFTYPIIRTRVENLYTNFSLLSKDMKDEVSSTSDITKKDTKSLKIGFDYEKNYLAFNKNTNSKISFNYTYGRLNFDDSAKEVSDKNGANTQGNYSKINLDLEHNTALTKEFTLESSLKMQYVLANKNLDGSEDFSIGGAYGVKVYPDGELSAENGYLFSTELKYKLPTWNALNSSLGVFYDRGKAFMANNTVGFESKSLQDIGIGYYGSYKDFFGQVQVAWTANSDAVSSEPTSNSRILFQGGWSF